MIFTAIHVIPFFFFFFFPSSPATPSSITAIDNEWLAAHGPPPYYLDRPSRTYRLDVDVTSPGTAFAISARNVTFDLGGRTITYGDSPPVIVPNGDFELEGGWEMPASGATFAPGTFVQPVSVYSGDRALRFQTPVPDQSIRTLTAVQLEPDTAYTLSAMFYNKLNRNNGQGINLFVRLEGTDIEISQRGITWRGFQYRSVFFRTGGLATAHRVVVGIENSGGSTGPVYVDDIRIQTTRTHGIVVGLPNWQRELAPDVGRYRPASNSVVRNGTIRQGQGRGDKSHGILVGAANDQVEVHDLNVHVHGADGRNILFHENCDAVSIHDNVLTSNVRTITSRDQIDGIMIYVGPGMSGVDIYRNSLAGGPQGGIRTGRRGQTSRIYDNTVSLRGLYSNGFGIWVERAEAWGNRVECHRREFACRGIMAGDDSHIHDNEINVRSLPINQEYEGCSPGGAYGIQSEGALNSTVRNNVVNAYSDECEAVAFRINDHWRRGRVWGNSDVFENRFVAIQRGSRPAYTVRASNVNTAANLQFHHNTLVTNSGWLAGDNVEGQVFMENTFSLRQDYSRPLRSLVSRNSPARAVKDIRFINNRYKSPTTDRIFSRARWRTPSGRANMFCSHVVGWEVAVVVQDGSSRLAGVQVEILDNTSKRVFVGTTNSEGRIEAIVDEFRVASDQRTVFGPFQVEVNGPKGSRSKAVDIDQSMTVVVDYRD